MSELKLSKMIDLTTIQTFEVSPDVKILSEANIILTKQNKLLKNILIVAVVGGAIYITFRIIKSVRKSRLNIPNEIKIVSVDTNENINIVKDPKIKPVIPVIKPPVI